MITPILQAVGTLTGFKGSGGTSRIFVANAALAIAFLVTATLYCVAFVLRLHSLSERPGIIAQRTEGDSRYSPLRERVILQMMAVGMQVMVILADTLLVRTTDA